MKKLKMFIIFILIFVFSGCSVEYNLIVNEDNTINEKVIAQEKTKRMESLTRLKGKQAVSYLYDMFKKDDQNVKISSREDEYNTYATTITSYNDITEYASKFNSDVFDKVKIEKEDDKISFTAVQSNLLGGNSSYSLVYDDITINITIPYEVIDNNADEIKGNVYIWRIDKSEEYKTIKISYKEGNQKDKINVKLNDKTYNIGYGIAIVGIMVLIIGLIVLFVYIKNKKNNVV